MIGEFIQHCMHMIIILHFAFVEKVLMGRPAFLRASKGLIPPPPFFCEVSLSLSLSEKVVLQIDLGRGMVLGPAC